jgi:hypothetical protein
MSVAFSFGIAPELALISVCRISPPVVPTLFAKNAANNAKINVINDIVFANL